MKKYILLEHETVDDAYQRIAGEQGLFNAAFSVKKLQIKDKQKLNYIWKQLIKQEIKRKETNK